MEIKVVKHQSRPHLKAVIVDYRLYYMQDGLCYYITSKMRMHRALFKDLQEIIDRCKNDAVPVYAGDTLEIRV